MRIPLPILLMLLLAAAQPILSQDQGDQAEDPCNSVVWADTAHVEAHFIPARLLQTTPLDKLPLTAREIDRLNLSMSSKYISRKEAETDIRSCVTTPDLSVVGGPELPDAPSLTEYFARHGVTLLGKVANTASAWDVRREEVVTLVCVRAIRQLHDVEARVSSTYPLVGGETILFDYQLGYLSFGGKSQCNSTDHGIYEPEVGDTLLVNGSPSASSESFLDYTIYFLVSRGMIIPQNYSHVRAGMVTPLTGVEAGLAATSRSERQ